MSARILVVDDTPVNRKLLRFTLEAENMTVLEAADGVEAMEILRRGRVDAVISDILMPRMDGYRLCREVRAGRELKGLPFVFHTATYTSASDEKFALQLGANAFIRKPAHAAVIRECLVTLLQSGVNAPGRAPELPDELVALKEYSERLVAKLEQRNLQLTRQTEELVRVQETYRDLLENTSDLVHVILPHGRLLFANRSWRVALGYTLTEILRLTIFDVIHPNYREFCGKKFADILAGSSPAPFEVALVAKDQRKLIVEANVKPQLADGEVVALRCILRDVTKPRRAEETHEHLTLQLNHHLRTSLNSIVGASDLLLAEFGALPRSEIEDLLGMVRTSGARLERTVSELLEFAEVEGIAGSPARAARARLKRTSDAATILRDSAQSEAEHHRRAADLILQIAEKVEMPVSPRWLKQLVVRPLDNAFSYSPAGTPVEFFCVSRANILVITIRDRGPGIPPGELAAVQSGEPKEPAMTEGHGLGVGLAITRRLAEIHGGEFTIESEMGRGTVVTITLPQCTGAS
ncbi:MAG TPA: response regulator [Opitutaceae bacterium]